MIKRENNNGSPIIRKPFDLQEAVVLLDIYLQLVKNGSSLAKAAEVASVQLRTLAVYRGFQIDDSFRSAMGLSNRLRSLGALFEGKVSRSAPGTVAFADAVALYNEDRPAYEKILCESREAIAQISCVGVGISQKRTPINKTRFVKLQRDQKLKEQYPSAFKAVYYTLKDLTKTHKSGITATEVFAALNKEVLRKDITAILTGASWSKQIKRGRYVFYDKDLEDRRKKQMEEKQKAAESEFFQWLPSAISPVVLEDIRKSYLQINSILIKTKVLPQPLTNITLIGTIEDALRVTKKTFANKRLRNTAIKLLSAYLAYLREKKNTIPESKAHPHIEIQQDWIRFNFSNSSDFERTVPTYCSIDGEVITGKNWARILVGITELEIKRNNSALADLYKLPLVTQRKERPYMMKRKIDGLNCAQLTNGYWININHSIPRLMELIQALCLHCGYKKEQVYIYGIPKEATSRDGRRPAKLSANIIPIEKIEEHLKTYDLHGATAKELVDALQPGSAISPMIQKLDDCMSVICMPGNRYVHADCFVDLDEAEALFGNILETHFAQFGGYSNNQLLFGAATRDLSMFLNDNDCENIDAVYALAKFFFEKRAVAGRPYKFSTPHIFKTEPDYPMTLRGLMIRLARSNGGILYASEAKDYLQKTMLTYGGIGQLLQIGSSNTFLMYDAERYLLSDNLEINDAWCLQMHKRIDDLFRRANVAYVIPRDISTAWLSTLPALPQGLEWTHLLLQEVLEKYPSIGFKSISPDLNQTYDTLAAAFVPIDSPLQSFPDVVTLFMEERHKLPLRMEGEDLRIELRDAGMLEGGEMIYALPKALDDYRFAWSNENKTVYVRGN